MASTELPGLSSFQLRHLVATAVRAIATVTVLLVLYYTIPIVLRDPHLVLLRVVLAIVFFIVVVGVEVRLIANHERPVLRATVAMATIIPMFLVVFAWIYLTMSHSSPQTFGGELSRTSSLYFTVTVFSTVGFGDIAPKTDVARLVTTVQMLADLAIFFIVVRLILGAVSRGSRQRATTGGQREPESD